MQQRAILVAVLLAAPAVGGCLGTASAATATDHRDQAHERAQQWDSQAELAEVVGLEGQAAQWMGSWGFQYHAWYGPGGDYGGDYGSDYDGRDQPGSPSEDEQGPRMSSSHRGTSSPWARAAEDEEMADGRCRVWAYTYVSENKPDETLTVILDEEGNLLANHTDDREDERALSNWEIDSDEAVEIAKEANAGVREGQNSEYRGFVYVLEEDPDHENPTWTVAGGGGDASGGGGGVVIIDAVTGEVLESHGGASSR